MELIVCANCISVYGAVQDECPGCGADANGEGAELELDSVARAALVELGGLFGGILEAGDGVHLLWCARGVLVYRDDIGLAWKVRVDGRVEGVRVNAESVRVSAGGGDLWLALEDGSEL